LLAGQQQRCTALLVLLLLLVLLQQQEEILVTRPRYCCQHRLPLVLGLALTNPPQQLTAAGASEWTMTAAAVPLTLLLPCHSQI
jgi:hypothetical protein